jgi:hypothetical protein
VVPTVGFSTIHLVSFSTKSPEAELLLQSHNQLTPLPSSLPPQVSIDSTGRWRPLHNVRRCCMSPSTRASRSLMPSSPSLVPSTAASLLSTLPCTPSRYVLALRLRRSRRSSSRSGSSWPGLGSQWRSGLRVASACRSTARVVPRMWAICWRIFALEGTGPLD